MANARTLERRFRKVAGVDERAVEVRKVEHHLQTIYGIFVRSDRWPDITEMPSDDEIHAKAVEIVREHKTLLNYQTYSLKVATDRQKSERQTKAATNNPAVVDIG